MLIIMTAALSMPQGFNIFWMNGYCLQSQYYMVKKKKKKLKRFVSIAQLKLAVCVLNSNFLIYSAHLLSLGECSTGWFSRKRAHVAKGNEVKEGRLRERGLWLGENLMDLRLTSLVFPSWPPSPLSTSMSIIPESLWDTSGNITGSQSHEQPLIKTINCKIH